MTKDNHWPRRQPTAQTGALGVTKTQLFFQAAGWLFREQPLEDYGIDAHVEIVEGGNVKGRLVALQIKSGDSWLRPIADGGWHFYPEKRHVNYWQNHSLPVAVVVWHQSTDTLFFREASPHTIQKTESGGWKLHFSEDHRLTESALPGVALLSAGTTYDLRLRSLRLLLPWMQRIDQGQRLILRADEWVNRSKGRGDVEIVAITQDGTERQLGKWAVMLGGRPYNEILPSLFAWADLSMNPDVEWDLSEELATHGPKQAIRPYAISHQEVAHWSLEFSLNSIGRAFLLLDDYAGQG